MPNGSFIKILGISEPTCDNIFTTNPLARSFENWTRLAKTNFFKLHSSYRQGFWLWLVGCCYQPYLYNTYLVCITHIWFQKQNQLKLVKFFAIVAICVINTLLVLLMKMVKMPHFACVKMRNVTGRTGYLLLAC